MIRNLAALEAGVYDILIIGGGITGACVAWDAVLRGLRVALVEKNDFGGATSAATSKLLHGGLRYLKQLELGVVRESLRERRILATIAPHLVRPLPFLIPTYRFGSNRRLIIGMGLMIYDTLAYDADSVADPALRLGKHQSLSAREVLALEPNVSPFGLTGGMLYWDYQVHSMERMTLEFILSAAARGAQVANQAEVLEVLVEGGWVQGARVRDRLDGKEYLARARVVVNAAGPWADRVMEKAGLEASQNIVASKGIHIITRPLTQGHALATTTPSGRHIFILPWRGRTLIGTTDTPYQGSPDALRVEEGEICGLLEEAAKALPRAKLSRRDVEYAYGGIRPLSEASESATYKASRRWTVMNHGEEDGIWGLISALGGKYTTSRNLARKVVDMAIHVLAGSFPPCVTDRVKLDAAAAIELKEEYEDRVADFRPPGLSEEQAREMVRTYGTRWERLLPHMKADPSLGRPLAEGRPEIGAQVVLAVQEEMALTLKDIVLRRTGLGTVGDPGHKALQRAAAIAGGVLGWDQSRQDQEVEAMAAHYRYG